MSLEISYPKKEAQTRMWDKWLQPQSAGMQPTWSTHQASQALVLAEPTGGALGAVARHVAVGCCSSPGTWETVPHNLPKGERHIESSPFLEDNRPYWSSDTQAQPLAKANVGVKRANVKIGSRPPHPHSAPGLRHKPGLVLRGSQNACKRKEL